MVSYVAADTELYRFLVNAQPSLIWILGESIEFRDITVGDFLSLGADACVCRAHVSCTTTTAYETRELELDYQLLCVRTEDGWCIQDMAYD